MTRYILSDPWFGNQTDLISVHQRLEKWLHRQPAGERSNIEVLFGVCTCDYAHVRYSINAEKKQLELSFRSADSSKEPSSLKLSDLSVGQKVDAIVKKIEDYGLFLAIEGSKLRGLCHKSEVIL